MIKNYVIRLVLVTFLARMNINGDDGVQAIHSLIGKGCRSDNECLEDRWEFCSIKQDMTEKGPMNVGTCEHKHIFPMKPLEFWGLATTFVILWFTNMGGLGGGGSIVPISMLFFRFDAKNAIALSNISIFLASFIRFIIFAKRPHPLKNGKGLLVDMNLSILMLPLIISGVSIGVILNILFPDLVIIVSYALGLAFLGRGVFKKALIVYRSEVERDRLNLEKDEEVEQLMARSARNADSLNRESDIQLEMVERQNGSESPQPKSSQVVPINLQSSSEFGNVRLSRQSSSSIKLSINQDSSENGSPIILDQELEAEGGEFDQELGQNGQDEIQGSDELQESPEAKRLRLEKLKKIIDAESTPFQWTKLALNWGLIIILIVFTLFKGGSSPNDSLLGIVKCGKEDWVIFGVLQVICVIFLLLGLCVLKKEYRMKTEVGYDFIEGDLKATPSNIGFMIAVSFFGSIFASFSGLGPGMVFCPALIMIGIESQVGTATGMYLTMFTTLASTIQMVIHKRIKLDYAAYLLAMTAGGTFIGLFFQRYMVDTYNRVSYQNFVLVVTFFLACALAVFLNIPIIIHRSEVGEELFMITDYCKGA